MTAPQTGRLLRWLVIAVLSMATAVMVAVSLRANYLFAYGFGQTAEKAQVFAWANVAADLWKVTGLIVIGALWRARQKRIAGGLVPIWLLCLLWGLAGAVGVYAQDRTNFVGQREAKMQTLRQAERELAEIDGKLGNLIGHLEKLRWPVRRESDSLTASCNGGRAIHGADGLFRSGAAARCVERQG